MILYGLKIGGLVLKNYPFQKVYRIC